MTQNLPSNLDALQKVAKLLMDLGNHPPKEFWQKARDLTSNIHGSTGLATLKKNMPGAYSLLQGFMFLRDAVQKDRVVRRNCPHVPTLLEKYYPTPIEARILMDKTLPPQLRRQRRYEGFKFTVQARTPGESPAIQFSTPPGVVSLRVGPRWKAYALPILEKAAKLFPPDVFLLDAQPVTGPDEIVYYEVTIATVKPKTNLVSYSQDYLAFNPHIPLVVISPSLLEAKQKMGLLMRNRVKKEVLSRAA